LPLEHHIRGTLIFEASCAGGSLSDLRIDDGGDCCIRCHIGTYDLTQLRLRCSHGAALLVDGRAQATHTDCVLVVCLLEIKENTSLESESGEA